MFQCICHTYQVKKKSISKMINFIIRYVKSIHITGSSKHSLVHMSFNTHWYNENQTNQYCKKVQQHNSEKGFALHNAREQLVIHM